MASTTSVASTLIGPLTTRHTPPATSCNIVFRALNPATPEGWYIQAERRTENGAHRPECYPPGFDRDNRYFYSPGVCPSGYNVAYRSSGITDGSVATTATCFPGGYACSSNPPTDNIYACTSVFRSEVRATVMPSVNYETITMSDEIMFPILTGSITTNIARENTINHYGVIVASSRITLILRAQPHRAQPRRIQLDRAQLDRAQLGRTLPPHTRILQR
ncbi:hypothetical protein F5Y14DRAFT_355076 [Nemania sp. NC0429]|nr:hypothetical protein F5Y14DRAFT_355076 [Nemania sp. NC0429]